MASSLFQREDTLRVGDEGLPARGQASPDGSRVQLDQAQPTTERGGEERGS